MSEPTGHEPESPSPTDQAWEFFVEYGFRASNELRDCLGVDEDGFRMVAATAWGDSRSYLLYAALDEVDKAAMQLMRLQETLQGETVSPDTDRVSRLAVQHLVEEERARERRLLEVLVTLILFAGTNEQPYYRHFLLLEELQQRIFANEDNEEFYGARSRNIDASIAWIADMLRDQQKQIDFTRAWYLSDAARKRQVPDGEVSPSVLAKCCSTSTMRKRVQMALPLMTPREKTAFGLSYGEAYSRASESVHFAPSQHPYSIREADAHSAGTKVGLLVLNLIDRCHRLLGRPDLKVTSHLVHILSQDSETSSLLFKLAVRDIGVGDFVLAYGDLAEVIDVKDTPYGNRSYKVRYLAERPMPGIDEDWFAARHVQRLYTSKELLNGLAQFGDKGKLPDDIVARMHELPADELQDIVRRTITDVWNLGLRDWVRHQAVKHGNATAAKHGKGEPTGDAAMPNS